jgi:hypothetical protein
VATVLRIDGFRVAIWPNDHEPAHVHVYNADGVARITIGGDGTRPEILSATGMKDKDSRRARRIVEDNQDVLDRDWRRIHGA